MERPRDSGETEVKLSINETSHAQAMRKVICAKKKGGPIMKTVSKPLAARRNQDSPISDSLLVNMAIIGLVLMFVAAVWIFFAIDPRSEERRVGKGCRTRWSAKPHQNRSKHEHV